MKVSRLEVQTAILIPLIGRPEDRRHHHRHHKDSRVLRRYDNPASFARIPLNIDAEALNFHWAGERRYVLHAGGKVIHAGDKVIQTG